VLRALILPLLLAQTPPAVPPTETAAERSAQAAEKAADAAEKAAEAAGRAANAAERIAQQKAAAPVAEPACVPAAPPAPPPPSPWAASVGLGLISLTGNTQSITFTGNALAQHTGKDWVFALNASGTYGQSRAEDASQSQVLALKAALQLRGDRRFGERVTAYLLAGGYTDHVKSVEYGALGEAGAGLVWLDPKPTGGDLYFRTDLGLRYDDESRFQYFPTPLKLARVQMVAPRLGLEFRATLAPGLAFIQTAEVLTNVVGDSRTVFNSLSKISVHLVGKLSLGTSFAVAFDSAPAPGKVPTDTALALELDYAI
jgi:putative salt-induced outer membrane protein YdiY